MGVGVGVTWCAGVDETVLKVLVCYCGHACVALITGIRAPCDCVAGAVRVRARAGGHGVPSVGLAAGMSADSSDVQECGSHLWIRWLVGLHRG